MVIIRSKQNRPARRGGLRRLGRPLEQGQQDDPGEADAEGDDPRPDGRRASVQGIHRGRLAGLDVRCGGQRPVAGLRRGRVGRARVEEAIRPVAGGAAPPPAARWGVVQRPTGRWMVFGSEARCRALAARLTEAGATLP